MACCTGYAGLDQHILTGPKKNVAGSGSADTQIVAVEDLQAGDQATQFTTTELFARDRHDQPLRWTGQLPVRMVRALEEHGHDVRELLRHGPGPVA